MVLQFLVTDESDTGLAAVPFIISVWCVSTEDLAAWGKRAVSVHLREGLG